MRMLAYQAARIAGRLSRKLGRGGGTSLPGMLLLRLRPNAAQELAGEFAHGVATVSATNGKTSTARLLVAIADEAGWITVANSAGANLITGVTTALLEAPKGANFALFEVDEAALPEVARQIQPRVILLMNLFRDQLDRFGELDTLVNKWAEMIDTLGPETTLVINADDPGLAALADNRDKVVWFGVDDPSVGRATLAHAADSTHCARCDSALTYSLITIGHLGHWSCEQCGFARPQPQVSATRVHLRAMEGSDMTLRTTSGDLEASTSLPGLHNAYNATAAAATALSLGIATPQIQRGLAKTHAAFGRAETLDINGRSMVLLLAKNPAGANENIRTVALQPDNVHVLVLLNDRTADGQDVSWIWDVDYEALFPQLASLTLGGTRSYDLALRFQYGGLEADQMEVSASVSDALDTALRKTPAGDTLFVLPTYTAMLDLREVLVERGVTHEFWEDR